MPAIQGTTILVAVSLKAYFGYVRTRQWLEQLAQSLAISPIPTGVELAVFPSSPLLESAGLALRAHGAQIGAQDVSWAESGPMTGEVPASLLAEMGCRYAEIGHAERRRWFDEDDTGVSLKAAAAAKYGLVPLICIGEESRDDPDRVAFVVRQAQQVLDRIDGKQFVLAYEPIWAIGADAPADTADSLRIADALRSAIPCLGASGRLIYGGTAGSGSLSSLRPGFDGVFLGRRAHQIEGLTRVLQEAAGLVSHEGEASGHSND